MMQVFCGENTYFQVGKSGKASEGMEFHISLETG